MKRSGACTTTITGATITGATATVTSTLTTITVRTGAWGTITRRRTR